MQRTQRLFSLSDVLQVGVLVYLFSDFSHRSSSIIWSSWCPFCPIPQETRTTHRAHCSGCWRIRWREKMKQNSYSCPLSWDCLRLWQRWNNTQLQRLLLWPGTVNLKLLCVPVCWEDKHAGMLDVPHKQEHALLHFPSCPPWSLFVAMKKAGLRTTSTDKKATNFISI